MDLIKLKQYALTRLGDSLTDEERLLKVQAILSFASRATEALEQSIRDFRADHGGDVPLNLIPGGILVMARAEIGKLLECEPDQALEFVRSLVEAQEAMFAPSAVN